MSEVKKDITSKQMKRYIKTQQESLTMPQKKHIAQLICAGYDKEHTKIYSSEKSVPGTKTKKVGTGAIVYLDDISEDTLTKIYNYLNI
jgi:hypothetical protein|uniref:NET domain-containing protein n=1 Tax=viral metagenome TaxID=1070528 RepID=A0A6C0IWL5_9ZZZZ